MKKLNADDFLNHREPQPPPYEALPDELLDEAVANSQADLLDTESKSRATASPAGVSYPAPLQSAAFAGPVGEAVRLIAPHSEADPAVLLVRLLSACGAMIGRKPHVDIDGIEHAPRIWPIVVGSTGNGRKGQSWGSVRRLLKLIDADFAAANIASGLTTGQGLVHAIRDPIRAAPKTKREREEADSNEDGLFELDAGVADKRLLVREPEMAKVLAAASREGNNLSATLRNAWDGESLRELTRTNPYAATDPHVVLQADVTPAELQAMLAETDKANGFANRFLFVASRRSKSLPFGGGLDERDLQEAAAGIADAILHARQVGRMQWSPAARPMWAATYDELNDELGDGDSPGSMLIARAATHVLRLSIAYALLNGRSEIDVPDLEAAVELWRYCRESAAWAFGEAAAEADPIEQLFAWACRQEDPPSPADVRRSGPRRYRGTRPERSAVADFETLVEAGRGSFDYAGGTGRPSRRFRPKRKITGYETPPHDPASRGLSSVSSRSPQEKEAA
jgi:hypothetical protein